MSEKLFTVEESQEGDRLDVFLVARFLESLSRTVVRRLIDDKCVTVNGQHARAGYNVQIEDRICVQLDEGLFENKALPIENIALDIIYEDSYLLVINKPVGMLVHPVRGQNFGTLVNALLHHCEKLSTVNDADRPGIVHRLDRETSGIMIVVKDDSVHENLAMQFARRKVKKKYIAIVKGSIEFDEGVIDAPITRHATYFDKKAIASGEENGRNAKTTYQVLKRIGSVATIVALFPKTGRTHQLRVHMKYLGNSILGDEKYGNVNNFPRLALHAQTIRFYHPGISCFLEFSCPLPQEFLDAEAILSSL